MAILVMPLLRRYDSPPFNTVGEAVDFFRQIFEVWLVRMLILVSRHLLKSCMAPCPLGSAIHAPSPCRTSVGFPVSDLRTMGIHITYRDCMNLNIMMDPKPLFPEMFHPRVIDWSRDLQRPAKHFARTTHPTKYYFIDFGLSRKYDPDGGPPREPPIYGGDKSVPEFRRSPEPCDPFPTDIYYIGNLIREDFLQVIYAAALW